MRACVCVRVSACVCALHAWFETPQSQTSLTAHTAETLSVNHLPYPLVQTTSLSFSTNHLPILHYKPPPYPSLQTTSLSFTTNHLPIRQYKPSSLSLTTNHLPHPSVTFPFTSLQSHHTACFDITGLKLDHVQANYITAPITYTGHTHNTGSTPHTPYTNTLPQSKVYT